MLKKLTQVNEANKFILNGIVCCYTIDDNGIPEYSYLTKEESFIEYSEAVNGVFDADEFMFSYYDLLNRRAIEKIFFPAFLGEVYSVASLTIPRYHEYLASFDLENYEVNYNDPVYRLSNFDLVPEDHYDRFDAQGRVVNSEKNSKLMVSNFTKEHFKESVGYLYLGSKSGPKFLNEEIVENFDIIDKESLGIIEDEKCLMLKTLLINFGGDVVDLIILNENKEQMTPAYHEPVAAHAPVFEMDQDEYFDDEYDEYDSFEIEDEELDVDVIDDVENIDDIDEEFEVEVEVDDVKNKKDALDNIDDIDDDIEIGDL